MASITFHFVEARGGLLGHRDWIHERLLETFEKATALLPLRPLDVVVKAGTQVIPEKGHLGYVPEPGLIFLTVDPTSQIFAANPGASLERMFAHELHHAARWDGPGYGSSLGEALVSEGLAGAFAQELYGGAPEPWERLPVGELRQHIDMAESFWSREDYGHATWFFGASDLPRWLGYSLGFQLVTRYLAEHEGSTSHGLVETDAQAFRSMLAAI